MWHGCVESPASSCTLGAVPKYSAWEQRELYLDELEQHIPVEVRRARPGAGVGKPPPDKIVQKIKTQCPRRVVIDISGTQDGTLTKEIVQVNGETLVEESAEQLPRHLRILQGARVDVVITVTDADRDRALEARLLHGPKEHSWTAGSGSRCELVELAVASMRLGEGCIVRCKDPALFADSGLGIGAASAREVEYFLQARHASPTSLPADAQALFRHIEEQKGAAAMRLKEGKVQLALVKYRIIREELSEALSCKLGAGAANDAQWGPADTERAESLRQVIELNRAACLLRLGRWPAVCEACDAILARDGKNVKALFRRGKARLKLGDVEPAMRDFAGACEADPENVEAKQHAEQCRAILDRSADRARFQKERRGTVERGKWD